MPNALHTLQLTRPQTDLYTTWTQNSDIESHGQHNPPDQIERKASTPEGKAYHLPIWRKCTILFVVSWMTLAVTFSSTSLLPATPKIASDFSTTTEILNFTNAGVLLAMGFSTLIWGPINSMIGRRNAYNCAVLVLCGCSAGTAAAVDMRMFTVMRILSGLTGTVFMVSGQTILADIFEPVVRGTAVGFFMVGTVSGPAIGPCIGGIIVTFAHWRIIYWLQVAMTGIGLILSLLLVPEINDQPRKMALTTALASFNPLRVFRQFIYPNIFLAYLTCGFLSAFQYTLLTSAHSIINPRFNLTTPLISGLFYIAPGAGFLLGSIIGGHFSDRTVKKYISKRNGVRLAQDRLNSGLFGLFAVVPGSALIYAWTLQEGKGGLVVPVISAFVAGFGLMGCFNGLNTYAAEALPSKRFEVMSGKYIVQYFFGAGSTAVVVPVIDVIGVGWTFTICAALSIIGGLLVWVITRWGVDMQTWTEMNFDPQ